MSYISVWEDKAKVSPDLVPDPLCPAAVSWTCSKSVHKIPAYYHPLLQGGDVFEGEGKWRRIRLMRLIRGCQPPHLLYDAYPYCLSVNTHVSRMSK